MPSYTFVARSTPINADWLNDVDAAVFEGQDFAGIAPINVKDPTYGAVGNGTIDDTAAFQAAYDACPANGAIIVPPGAYNISALTGGSNNVIWYTDGATNAAGTAPLDLPGTTQGRYEKRLLINQNDSESDDYSTVQIQRDANYTGGTSGFVNSALRANTVVRSGVQAYEWAIVGSVDNYSASGEPTGIYAQGIRRSGASATWGATLEFRDESGSANPSVGCVGVEVDVWANGTDSSNSRVGIDVTIGRPTGANASGSQNETAYGVRVVAKNNSSAEGRVKRAFYVGIDCDVAFDASGATYSAGGVAFRMAEEHKFSYTATNDRYMTYDAGQLQYWNGGVTPALEIADTTNTLNVYGPIQVLGTQVVTSRRTGYTNAMTGTANRATTYDTATITLAQLAGRVMALQEDLTTHGLIGA